MTSRDIMLQAGQELVVVAAPNAGCFLRETGEAAIFPQINLKPGESATVPGVQHERLFALEDHSDGHAVLHVR